MVIGPLAVPPNTMVLAAVSTVAVKVNPALETVGAFKAVNKVSDCELATASTELELEMAVSALSTVPRSVVSTVFPGFWIW